MNLLEEIREHFAATHTGIRELKSLTPGIGGWSIRFADGYGVAIPNKYLKEIHEKFANAKIESRVMIVEGEKISFLMLICSLESLRYEFAVVCAQFAENGEDGTTRESIQSEPLGWWKKWRTLLGNAISDKTAYNVIAEMLALEYLMSQGISVDWSGAEFGTHDIETEAANYEVKSTILKYSTTVVISSQNQLKSEKELFLYFCRMEESFYGGVSIDDMVKRLVKIGYEYEELEQKLISLGFGKGTGNRNDRYNILEKRKYHIDDSFPQITAESFKNDKIPEYITHITYTVDLNGLTYSLL